MHTQTLYGTATLCLSFFRDFVYAVLADFVFVPAGFTERNANLQHIRRRSGVTARTFFVQDYWDPLLVFGSTVGFEDFLYGFSIGGIASVLYEVFFKRRFARKFTTAHHWRFLLCIYALSFAVLFMGRQVWGLNTMYATFGAL